MSKILMQLLQQLKQEEQNKLEILDLIKQAKIEDQSLSKTINIEKDNDIETQYKILAIIVKYSKKENLKEFLNAVLLNSKIDIKNTTALINSDGASFEANFSAIAVAIGLDNIESIKTLLEIDPDLKDNIALTYRNGTTLSALGVAIVAGKKESIKTLIETYPDLKDSVAKTYPQGAKLSALGVAVELGKIESIKTLLEIDRDLKDSVALTYRNGTTLTSIGVAIVAGKIESIKTLLEIDPDLKDGVAQTYPNGTTLSALGVAIVEGKKESIKFLLENCPDLKDGVALTYQNGATLTALGVAIVEGKKESIKDLLENYPDLKNGIAKTYRNGTTLRALGVAVESGKIELMKVLMETYPDLKDGVAKTYLNGSTSSALGVAIELDKVESIKALLDNYPDLKDSVAHTYPNGTTFTAFGVAVALGKAESIKTLIETYPDLINGDVQKNPNGTTFTALGVAVSLGKTELINILLENGADYDKLDGKGPDVCPPALQVEIDKIKKTKKVFEGDLSIPAEEINENYMHYLCKKSGIPDHLLKLQDKPNSAIYFEIVNKFQSNQDEVKTDLNVFLGEIFHKDNPLDFPAIRGFDYLESEQFSRIDKDIDQKTIKSYEKKPHLKPENFLNNQEFDEKLTILVRNNENADIFFEVTKNWILPQKQHLVLQKLREEYFKTPPHIRKAFTQEHQESLENRKKLLEMSKGLTTIKNDLLVMSQEIGDVLTESLSISSDSKKRSREDGEMPIVEVGREPKPRRLSSHEKLFSDNLKPIGRGGE
jgi:hypothetical protein